MSKQIMLYVNRASEDCDFLWIYGYSDHECSSAIEQIIYLLEDITALGHTLPVQKTTSEDGKTLVAGIRVYNHATARAIQIAASHLLDRLHDVKFFYAQGGEVGYATAAPQFPELCQNAPAISGFERLRSMEAIISFLDVFYENVRQPGAQPCY